MDSIVGDDIDIGVRQVVRQLLNLASDPDSQVLMAQQPGTLVSGDSVLFRIYSRTRDLHV